MPRSLALAFGLAGVAAVAPPAPATSTATFHFCWIGGAGYTMTGQIGFPAALLGTGRITENDVTAFAIQGFHEGVPVGRWSLAQLKPTTSWTLNFDTVTLSFPTGGIRSQNTYQAWNANGRVNDCGMGGFGFNGGNWAQDVCIDNTYIEVSSIDPDTPLQAFPLDTEITCEAVLPMM